MFQVVEDQKSVICSLFRVCSLSLLVIFISNSAISAQGTDAAEDPTPAAKSVNHNFYLGGKLGIIYVFGVEMNYILKSNDVNRMYLAAAAQTSFVVNSINAGGGFFVGKKGIGIGCRYHHLLWFESEKDSKIQPGYGPEVVWNKTIGTKYIINLHAGGIITKGAFFPDISFGVFLPLNK
jgi:hypothetical protein